MATRKPTLFQQAQKEIKRIKRAVSRIEKRGYVFGKIPGINKKSYSRKDVEKLKNLKAKDLYKYATAFGLRGEVYRERERSIAAQKGAIKRKYNLNVEIEEEKEDDEEFERKGWYRSKGKSTRPTASVSWDIIYNFLDEDRWIHLYNGLSLSSYQEFVDFIYNEIGKDDGDASRVADCLQSAKNAGVFYECQHSYDFNYKQNLSELQKYFPELAEWLRNSRNNTDGYEYTDDYPYDED